MFFYYETRTHHHKTIQLQDQLCPVCKNRGVLKMHLQQSYMWFFGPMIPSIKSAVLECEFCQTTIPNKKWNSELDAIYQKEKVAAKTPISLWRGSIVIVSFLLITTGMMKAGITNPFGLQDDQEVQQDSNERFKTIQVNDMMYISFADVNHKGATTDNGIMKVVSIDGNKLGVKIYDQRFDKMNFGYDLKLSDIETSKFNSEIQFYDLEKFHKNFNLHLLDNSSDNPFPFAYAKLIINK